MKDLVIIGAGGYAKGDLTWLIEDINNEKQQWNLIGFIDENNEKHGMIFNTYKVLGDLSWLEDKSDIWCIIGVGDCQTKKVLVEKLKKFNVSFATLIHPSVQASKYIAIGQGCAIGAGTVISGNVEIENHVIVNLNCSVGHDVKLRNYSTISPCSAISGNVEVGEASDIGTNSSIVQGVKIGKNSIIGAGTVVIKDIPDNCTAVGVPAKIIKSFKL